MEEDLTHTAGYLRCIRLELDDIARISGPIWKIAEILGRPTFWERLWYRVMNWRWRRRIAKGLPQKEWREETREALAEFEKKIESPGVTKWRPTWDQ